MSETRHRIRRDEVSAAIEAISSHLAKLCEEKADLDAAIPAFHLYWRLIEDHPGRPDYPDPITWEVIQSTIDNGTIIHMQRELEENEGESSTASETQAASP